MERLPHSPAWKALAAHHAEVGAVHMRDLFAADAGRFRRFSLRLDDLVLDYSKNRITGRTMELLLDLARQAEVETWRRRMMAGEPVNTSEGRAALHTALRAPAGAAPGLEGADVAALVRDGRALMAEFAGAVRSGARAGATGRRFEAVLNIGIGGSHLGPAMVMRALASPVDDGPEVRFVSNVDLEAAVHSLEPETTLVLIASKTFTTTETMTNARSARAWLEAGLGEAGAGAHMVALTANSEAARAFGIDGSAQFPFWDWVGGRYSLWSACGLSIALGLGMERFEELLAGAHAMDRHFAEAPLEANMPVILALLGVWYGGFFGARAHAVLPYDRNLALFPAYMQQLEMESNGKGVTRDGLGLDWPTAPVVFGAPGTDGQHAFHQLLHQGPGLVPADFIAAAHASTALGDHHDILLANFLAQAEALMMGRDGADGDPLAAHRTFPGNRPSNAILVRRMEARSLGMLIALYEHKVFVQGVIWGINPFDQWGVELGKELAGGLVPALAGDAPLGGRDASTAGLVAEIRRLRQVSP